MVGTCPHKRQAQGHIHCIVEIDRLERTEPLIVIHRHDRVEIALDRPSENRVSRQRPRQSGNLRT